MNNTTIKVYSLTYEGEGTIYFDKLNDALEYTKPYLEAGYTNEEFQDITFTLSVRFMNEEEYKNLPESDSF